MENNHCVVCNNDLEAKTHRCPTCNPTPDRWSKTWPLLVAGVFFALVFGQVYHQVFVQEENEGLSEQAEAIAHKVGIHSNVDEPGPNWKEAFPQGPSDVAILGAFRDVDALFGEEFSIDNTSWTLSFAAQTKSIDGKKASDAEPFLVFGYKAATDNPKAIPEVSLLNVNDAVISRERDLENVLTPQSIGETRVLGGDINTEGLRFAVFRAPATQSFWTYKPIFQGTNKVIVAPAPHDLLIRLESMSTLMTHLSTIDDVDPTRENAISLKRNLSYYSFLQKDPEYSRTSVNVKYDSSGWVIYEKWGSNEMYSDEVNVKMFFGIPNHLSFDRPYRKPELISIFVKDLPPETEWEYEEKLKKNE